MLAAGAEGASDEAEGGAPSRLAKRSPLLAELLANGGLMPRTAAAKGKKTQKGERGGRPGRPPGQWRYLKASAEPLTREEAAGVHSKKGLQQLIAELIEKPENAPKAWPKTGRMDYMRDLLVNAKPRGGAGRG
jgi:hypothetical protein